MNQTTTNSKEYAPGTYPDLPAPVITTGAVGWVRTNLLSSPLNIFLTVLFITGGISLVAAGIMLLNPESATSIGDPFIRVVCELPGA